MEDDGGSVTPTTIKIGPRLGLPLGNLSNGSTLFFGAEGRIGLSGLPIVANPSFDYYLTNVDNTTYFAVDLNALYELSVGDMAFVPYVGGGIGITRISFGSQTQFGSFSASTTEIGLNILGGARFPLGSIEPFAQLNAAVGADRVGITAGLLFGL
ncbi:MAG: P44/Msp2 family outer membrane protein [Salinibacter sp.]